MRFFFFKIHSSLLSASNCVFWLFNFKINLRYYYLFGFNTNCFYSFSEFFKVKKYENTLSLKTNQRSRLLVSLKYLLYVFVYLFNKCINVVLFILLKKINYIFYNNIFFFLFFFNKFLPINYYLFFNFFYNLNLKILKKKASVKRKRYSVLKKINLNNLKLINTPFF